jgi:hypothetical protein
MATASKGRPGAARPGAVRGTERTLSPLVVRYMRRMKRQRVYTYEVRWQDRSRRPASSSTPVVVRLVVAGAQVVPSERTMDAKGPQERALFYVTPLARGWLRGERLEVLVDGRKVQEIPLPSKVVSQRATWALLLLTIVVPWFWSAWIKQGEFTRSRDQPGTRLEKWIEDDFPGVPDLVADKVPAAADFLLDIRSHLRAGLNFLHYYSFEFPLVFTIAAAFLVLTALSLILHRDRRKRRVGKPIPVPEQQEGDGPPIATRSAQAAVEPLG